MLAGLAGLAINQFGLPIFGNLELIFGGWAQLLVAYVFGPWHGAVAAAIAMSSTLSYWGHPWGFATSVLEALAVGYLLRRRRGPFPAAFLYWLVVGTPLAAVGVLQFSSIPFPTNWAMVFKYPANSLLMTMIAIAIYNSRRFRRLANVTVDHDATVPLGRVLFQRFGLIIGLTTAILALLVGQSRNRLMRAQVETELAADAAEVSRDLFNKLATHERVLRVLAGTRRFGDSSEEFSCQLEQVRADFPDFLTMLAADRSGLITAAAPRFNADGTDLLAQPMNVSDRDYFRLPMTTGEPYISPVFRGRGFGDDLIVAMSVASAANDGTHDAIIEGSLNLKTFLNDVAGPAQINGRSMLVVDSIGQVVASSGLLELPVLSSVRDTPIARGAATTSSHTFTFVLQHEPPGELILAAWADVPERGWRIYLAEPQWRSQQSIAGYYIVTFFGAGLAIGVAVLLARATANDVTRPLDGLVKSIQELARNDTTETPTAEPQLSLELSELSRAAHDAALVLSRANREMANALEQRDRTHQQLRQVLLHLDEKVRLRTEELGVALQQAESANRAKSEFIAATSHELRTPLNVILGMSEVMLEGALGELTERQRESVRYIDESGRHLLSLINDILDLSKIEAGKLDLDLQEVFITDLCDASLRLVRPASAAKQQTLTYDNRAQAGTVVADARRMKQVLVNLLSNAVKFTPNGGSITLEVTEQPERRELTIAVVDTGIGVPSEYRHKLFQPFQQIDGALNRRHSGTGLGLALVRRITELHGGRADVESTPGVGSRFYVVLPLDRTAQHAPMPIDLLPAPGEPIPSIAGRHILIAEDNEANSLIYRECPAFAGARFTLARNGREAVEAALAEPPDLILMDVQMPEMDGLEATRLIRANPGTAHIPIIVITALAMQEDRARCLEAGATSYLPKPVSLRDLAMQAAEALHPKSLHPS